MFTTGNTHLKYRKHRVHSAAHKLKIRSSRLVLTTAGTDLDSTDRAAKNSSASEPLKRPILSLWNSRGGGRAKREMLILQTTAKTDREREGGRAKGEMLILQTTAKTDTQREGGRAKGEMLILQTTFKDRQRERGREGEERVSK